MLVLSGSSSSAATSGKRTKPVDRRPGPRPVTEQAISQGYRPTVLHEAARRTGDKGKIPPSRKTTAGSRHSVGVDRAAAEVIENRNDEISEQKEQSPTSVTRRARRNRRTQNVWRIMTSIRDVGERPQQQWLSKSRYRDVGGRPQQ